MEEGHLISKEEKRGKVFFAAAAAWCASVAMGNTLAYSSPALPELQSPTHSLGLQIDDNIASWFGSIMAIGAVLAAPVSGAFCDKLGRKTVLLFSSVPFVTGWLLIAYAKSVEILLLGRLLTGLCCGLVSLAVPVYIAEISPAHLRGLLGSCVQLSVTLGMFMTYGLGVFLKWRWLAITSTLFPILLLISMCFVPETPRWQLMKNCRSEAVRAIVYLNGTQVNAEVECQLIEDNLSMQPKGSITIFEVLQPHYMKLLFISLALMLFQQFSGINSFLFYAESIFEESDSSIDPKYSTTVIGAVLVVATLVASLLMDCAGRRILLLISASVMCISVTALATYCLMVHKKGKSFETEYAWLPLLCLCIFVSAFSLGFGPIPWLMMGELLPIRIRGLACSIATMFNWTCVFIVTKEFNDMINTLNDYGTYWTYGGFCVASCIFIYICLPETKGKTLEDIENIFVRDEGLQGSHSIN